MIKIEHNVQTGEIKEVELTAEEVKIFQAEAKKFAEADKAQQEVKATKAAQKAAVIAKLGITQDEAKLLLS